MYTHFQSTKDKWSVGRYSTTGHWLHDSDHNSKLEATQHVQFMNSRIVPSKPNMSFTIREIIDFIDHIYKSSKQKTKLARLKNILLHLSNYFTYSEQITQKNFLRIKNSGHISWLMYINTLIDLKKQQIKILNESVKT